MRGVFGLLSPAVMWVFVAAAFAAGEPCGILNPPGQYGPYDYWTDQDKLGIVEEFHFTKEIARMDPAIEIRFAGTAQANTVYGPFLARDGMRDGATYWSPVLEGERT